MNEYIIMGIQSNVVTFCIKAESESSALEIALKSKDSFEIQDDPLCSGIHDLKAINVSNLKD